MPEALALLLDQNVPSAIAMWLRTLKPSWVVAHTSEVGLSGKSDEEIYRWAQRRQAVIVTFDEDFADHRSFPVGMHHGVVRLRIWPTTTEETQRALERLLAEVSDSELSGALVIVGRSVIRVRPAKR